MYHHINPHAGDTVTITPAVFAAQMKFLHDEGYLTLSVDELIEFVSGTKTFAPKAVVITFDDGWLDNYLYAVPLLSRYQFKATFFIITGRVDSASLRERTLTADIPDHEDAKRLIANGRAELVVLDWETVNKMESSGLFSFFSHGVTHRKCADLSASELEAELARSKERLESALGRFCNYFCWPYGSFTDEAVLTAKKAGFTALFTTIDGFCESGSDLFMIKRIEVKDSVAGLKERLLRDIQ